MKITKLELVRQIRETIRDPAKWCQGGSALDSMGRFIPGENEKAQSWCVFGAACRAYNGGDFDLKSDFWDVMKRIQGSTSSVAAFNDSSTHEQVIARLDEVEAKLLQEEQAQQPQAET